MTTGPLRRCSAGNGYLADLHELQLTPQGSAYLTAYTLVRADLSSVGGSTDGALQDALVQQVDVKTGLVMFEWHAYGHVALTDSYANSPSDPNRPWDFFHLNSIAPDPWGDGNFLISSRNTWAAYEIDHHERLDPLASSAAGDRPFAWAQARAPPFSTTRAGSPITRSRSSTTAPRPRRTRESRVIHERIDFKHRTVTLLGRYVRTPPLLSGSQGDDQVLGNGDSFVGWGEDAVLHRVQRGRADRLRRAPAVADAGVSRLSLPLERHPRRATGDRAEGDRRGHDDGLRQLERCHERRRVARPRRSPRRRAWRRWQRSPPNGFETAVPVASAAPVFAVQALGAGRGSTRRPRTRSRAELEIARRSPTGAA